MKRHNLTIGAVAFAFALSALPSMAQEARPGGGERTGSATPRGGGGEARGGGESRPTGDSRGGGSSGGGMSGGSSMGTSSSPSAPSSSGRMDNPSRTDSPSFRDRAPRRDDDQSSGRRAVPRGGSTASGSTTRTTGSSGSTDRIGSSSSEPSRRAVPVNGRPRDGSPITGQSAERRFGLPSSRDVFYIYRPYYNPYGFYGPGFGYGLGYLYYDPFWYGGYGFDPYGYGGYGSGAYYGGSPYYSSGGYSQSYRDAGSLRLKIKPRDAQVFVDGYFVGVVDSFDGTFQKLTLDGGGHRIEVKAEGFLPVQFDVLITPGETVTYKGELERIK